MLHRFLLLAVLCTAADAISPQAGDLIRRHAMDEEQEKEPGSVTFEVSSSGKVRPLVFAKDAGLDESLVAKGGRPSPPPPPPAVACQWSGWGAWGPCSAPCGGGTQTRSRAVAVQAANGGAGCVGGPTETQSCNAQACAVNCVWDNWGSFGSCSASCGGGLATRVRAVRTAAAFGGAACVGSSMDTSACNTQACPVDCSWSPWGAQDPCSKSCAGGTTTRTRSVQTFPSNGGQNCVGAATETTSCNPQPCPVDCVWDLWGPTGPCSASCGGGTAIRNRTVLTLASNGGTDCIGKASDEQPCGQNPCPVDCSWQDWTNWTACTVTCSPVPVTQTRTRKVQTVAGYGGAPCTGDSVDKQACNITACPVDCVLSSWSEWGACSVSCGTGGKQVRARDKLTAPANGGKPCDPTGLSQEQACADSPDCDQAIKSAGRGTKLWALPWILAAVSLL